MQSFNAQMAPGFPVKEMLRVMPELDSSIVPTPTVPIHLQIVNKFNSILT
jgi:hypothetical protein